MEGGPSSAMEEQRDSSRRKLSVARLFNNDSFRRDSKVSLMANLCYHNMETFLMENDILGMEGYLLNKHVHVDACDENGQTILMMACQKGKLNFVQLLINQGADVNATDNDEWSPLINAAKEGHVEIAKELLDHGANLEQKELGGWTALMWACYKGRTNMAKLLLSKGADPNIQGQYHISCLMWSAGRGYSEIVRELICHGAKVNVGDKYGTTALLWAARKGYIEIVEDLLRAGANADTAGMYSWTPLIVATKGNFIDVVHLLLDFKSNVNAVDKDDCTALTIACKEGYTEIAEALLKAGAYVNYTHKDRVGDSNLIHACKAGHIEVVEALIKKYADIDYQDKKTALYWAVEKGYADIVRVLLKANPDTELTTKDGDTPLMKATRNRNSEIVQLLVDKKAKVSAVDKKGDTALHIAMRSRSKAIVEILLRNPKHSQLLYRPNKAGETPYNIDSCHQKNILGQIFGARRLNTNEDNENMLGYDLYSSALADFLSEPTLSMPICVGLYAKWGSGKSFLLNKLRDEMTNFAKQWVEPELEFTWLLFLLVLQFSVTLGFIIGLALKSWIVGVSVAAGMFLILYILLIIVWFGVHHYDFKHAHTISTSLAKKLCSIKLFIQVLFCHPSSTRRDDTTQANPIRFLFTEGTKVSSSGGENSVAIIIASLFKACEKEFGTFTSRLYTVFKPKSVTTSTWRWRHICCIPYFFVFYFIMLCLMAGILLTVLYGPSLPLHEAENIDAAINIGLIVIVTIIGITIIANVYTWIRMISALVYPAEKRLYRAIAHAEMAKSDDLQVQHSFVQLMSDMVLCMDAFIGTQTRLVIIVDGLDSCEQEKVLRNLDAVHLLFSNQNSPFITILAIDPHIIIKAIETNIHRLFQDININGHDYLRNIVHLPFFLQNSALRKVKLAQSISQSYKKNYWNDDRGESFSVSTATGLGLNRRLSSESSMSIPDRFKQGALSRKSSKKLKTSESIASSMGNLNRITGAHDLTKVLLTDDYFSDVNPRSMRRLMNVVYITGRLLKAFNVDFNWYHLASWVNITEQWPYRTSWIILFYEKNEDELEDNVSLKSIYDKVINQIPISKELEPLLGIDRDERKFEIFLSYHKASLQVIDLKMFLPFTINLDPYIRKVIKEDQQHMEEIIRLDTNVAPGPSIAPTPNLSQLAGWSSFDNPASRRQLTHRGPMSRTASYNQPPLMMVPSAQSVLWGSNFISPSGSQSPCTGVTCPAPFRNVYALPVDMADTKLSRLSVDGVCNLLNGLEGLNKSKLDKYKSALIENNINGRVLFTCDLDELKKILGMVFGDWELFRMLLLNLREQEMQGGSSQNDLPKNVHFLQQPGRKQTEQGAAAPLSESLASPRETVPPKKEFEKGPRDRSGSMKRQQHTLEKQVTLEEQMIVGALQTLSEEAQEDILEEQMLSMQEVMPSLPNPASCSTLSPIISDPDETMDAGSDVGSILSCAFLDSKEADILYIQTPPVSPGRQRYFSLGGGEDRYASKRVQVISANSNEMISSNIPHRFSFASATSSQASGINFLGTADDDNCITISCSPPDNLKYPKVHRPNKLHIESASSFERLNKIKNKIINVISPPRSNTPSPNTCKTKEKEPITAENISKAKGDTSDDSTDNEQSESTPLVSPFRPPKIGSKDYHRSAFVTPPDRPHADTSIELSKDPSMSLDSLLVQRNSDKNNLTSFLGSTTLNPLIKTTRHKLDEAYRATGSLDESQMKYPHSAGNVAVTSPEYDLKGILVKGKSPSVSSDSKAVSGIAELKSTEIISSETVL